MRKVLLSVLLVGSLFFITFQFSPALTTADSAHSSPIITQSTTLSPNIDPIQA